MASFWERQKHIVDMFNSGYEITQGRGIGSILMKDLLSTGQTGYEFSLTGAVEGEEDTKKMWEEIEAIPGGHKWFDSEGDRIYLWEDSLIAVINQSYQGLSEAIIISARKEFAEQLRDTARKYLKEDSSDKGRAYVLVQTQQGVGLQSIRSPAASPLIDGNYTKAVVEDYRHVLTDLTSQNPCGRLVIMDGAPGTGKTFLVRALMEDCKHALMVLIPSNVISAMSHPGFMNVLLKHQQPGRPIVLVVEDADECLGTRDASNIGSISTVLQFGAGILGDTLDIRVICTTNISIEAIDSAVVRDGRLCRRIYIGQLDQAQAKEIYKRLTDKDPGELFTEKFYTLAEIYRIARPDSKKVPLAAPKRQLGFSTRMNRITELILEDEDDD